MVSRFIILLALALSLLVLTGRAWSQSGSCVLDPSVSPNSSGGTYTRFGGIHDDYMAPPYGGGSNATAPNVATCTGAITYSFIWEPTVVGDPFPLSVVVCPQ